MNGHSVIDRLIMALIATAIVFLYMAVQWQILTHVIDKDMREMVMRALGTLDAALGFIMGYYFAGSPSSTAPARGSRSVDIEANKVEIKNG